ATGASLTSGASPPAPPSFPTRRSSDLDGRREPRASDARAVLRGSGETLQAPSRGDREGGDQQRHHRRAPSRAGRQRPDRCRRERSEEHTSELQSPCNLVCRLLLEKKKP